MITKGSKKMLEELVHDKKVKIMKDTKESVKKGIKDLKELLEKRKMA